MPEDVLDLLDRHALVVEQCRAEVVQVVINQGVTLPEAMQDEPDPLEVLRYSAALGRPQLVRLVDDALRETGLTRLLTRRTIRRLAPRPRHRL